MKIVTIAFLCLFCLSLVAPAQVTTGRSQPKKITFKPQQQTVNTREIPDLIIKEELFSDENGNKIINANEICRIRFIIENIGKGLASGVSVNVTVKGEKVPGVQFEQRMDVGDIPGESEKEINLDIEGKSNTQDGYAEFLIEVMESRGFDAFPLEMKIETRRFAEPRLVVADAVFSTEDGGMVKLNYPVNLRILVQNIGEGEAKDVKVSFGLTNPNCIFLGEKEKFEFAFLNRGETRELDFLFTASRRYTEPEIPVRVIITENFGRFGVDTVLSVGLQQNLTARNQVVIQGIAAPETGIEIASLSSDVDKNIPVTGKENPYRYALIIGNEDYSRYQRGLQAEANVEFARHDATIFKNYAASVFGVQEKNIFFLTDATSGEMRQKIDLISKLAARTADHAEIVFYYAGHGLPDEISKEPYLIPVDVVGTNLNAAIKLSEVYKTFGESGAQRITIFLDACFSGGGRDAGLIAARAVKVKPKEELITGNMVVFSASTGEQSAMPYAEKQHGMFTYFLLKKLQENGGATTYGQLADYLTTNVAIESLRVNIKEQDPSVKLSINVGDEWKNWKINQ
ncbi:MAG TPA: caspase family protein [Bacteroidales bacterium]|nr:caspase family protein [Bacteroidales bacterium]